MKCTMKKILSALFLMALVVVLAVVCVGAEEASYSEGLEFTSNGDGTCSVSGIGTCTDTEITIPPVSPEGDAVTSLGSRAFLSCTSLTAITIPDSVTSIGNSAFFHCTSLTAITIPEGVTSIGSAAFSNCTSLTAITIPEGVTSIGEFAFAWCTSLTSITIPDSVTSIGDFAFEWCFSLTAITIPEGVTSIGIYTFSGCASLTAVTIPVGVTSIGSFAFEFCTSLTAITIPEGVTSIGNGAFYKCTSLTAITIPDSVTGIGSSAFSDCTSLTDVYYNGTEAQWNEVTVGDDNDPLLNATIHFLGDLFDLTSASLTLGDSLTMNYYAKADPAYGTVHMRFTYRGKTEYVTGVPAETEGEYVFSLTGIAPQCMGETIKAELILTLEDGTELVVDTKASYSVREYCDDALAANPDNKALATLLADLLAYGDAAQDYTGFNADTPVSEGFEVAPSEWEDVTDTDFTLSDKTREDLRFASAGVRFGHINRLYFKIKAADLTGVTLTVNGKTYTAADLTLVEDTTDTYILYTDPVYATEFDKVFTAELSVDGEVIQTLTYSVKSYVYAKQNGENAEMAALARALYAYGRSAIAYKQEQ